MWKREYNILNYPHNYEINDHVKIRVEAKFGSCRHCGRTGTTFSFFYKT